MKVQLFLKLFLSSLFIAAVTSIYVFAWLANVESPMPFAGLVSSYILALISICFVVSWWLERGFFKILLEYDNSLHMLTHDLRNPVSAIIGFLDYLLKGVPGPINPMQKKMLISMHRASMRLLGMINNILDVAKVEAGQMKLELVPVSLNELAHSVVNLMEGMGENKHIEFFIEGSEGKINGDKVLLERTIVNLISNAIKFCHEDGHIKINIKEDENSAYLSISDDGEGIPSDKIPYIFEKYKQAGKKSTGTGLGLNLCRYVAELHKGKISVKSVEGKGTVFTVRIPKNLEMRSGRISVHK
ncbi:MAG: HAMP domain-containing histidine kinase [Elusimicrobiales bacterium]|nr:HAMP domain-containing histidine kinase [Elusimicrobiales bacterium]